MAKDQTVAVVVDILKADADALAAIKVMTGYNPSNTAYAVTKLQTAADGLQDANDKFAQAEAAFKSARDAHIAAQWAFHNAMLGAKQQVIAQYGDDSEEAQAVGLTRKSERAKPKRKNIGTNDAKKTP